MPTTSGNVVSVVNTGDPFATMSVGHLEDIVKGLTWLAERREVREEVMEAIGRGGKGGNYVTERVIKDIREVMNSEKYYPPGRVYEIREMEEGRVEIWKVGQERWKEMVLQVRTKGWGGGLLLGILTAHHHQQHQHHGSIIC